LLGGFHGASTKNSRPRLSDAVCPAGSAGGRPPAANDWNSLLEDFLDSPDVSRRHARITVTGEDARIEDLESKNGTYVTERKLEAATRLTDGDTIRLGSFELTFTAIRSPGSTESVPGGAARHPERAR
jgi:hypothetical protein